MIVPVEAFLVVVTAGLLVAVGLWAAFASRSVLDVVTRRDEDA
jgi:hypothetical protein